MCAGWRVRAVCVCVCGGGKGGDKWLNNVYTNTSMKKRDSPSTLSPNLQHLGKAPCWPKKLMHDRRFLSLSVSHTHAHTLLLSHYVFGLVKLSQSNPLSICCVFFPVWPFCSKISRRSSFNETKSLVLVSFMLWVL